MSCCLDSTPLNDQRTRRKPIGISMLCHGDPWLHIQQTKLSVDLMHKSGMPHFFCCTIVHSLYIIVYFPYNAGFILSVTILHAADVSVFNSASCS